MCVPSVGSTTPSSKSGYICTHWVHLASRFGIWSLTKSWALAANQNHLWCRVWSGRLLLWVNPQFYATSLFSVSVSILCSTLIPSGGWRLVLKGSMRLLVRQLLCLQVAYALHLAMSWAFGFQNQHLSDPVLLLGNSSGSEYGEDVLKSSGCPCTMMTCTISTTPQRQFTYR